MSYNSTKAAARAALEAVRVAAAALLKQLHEDTQHHATSAATATSLMSDLTDAFDDYTTAIAANVIPTTTSGGLTYDIMFSQINRNGVVYTAEEIAANGTLKTALLAETSKALRIHKPTAAFTMDHSSGAHPLAVAFTNTTTNAPTSYAWDFGDGSTSTSASPTHTFTTAGTRTVVLTATNAGGSHSVSHTVTVS